MPKTTESDDRLGLPRGARFYEQREGNKRYICPACGKPAIMSAVVGPEDYVCLATRTVVTAMEVATAAALEWPKE